MQCHLRSFYGVLLKPRCTNDIHGSFHEFHFCMAHGVTFSTRGAWHGHSSIGERQANLGVSMAIWISHLCVQALICMNWVSIR
jgi:hypothetical protein